MLIDHLRDTITISRKTVTGNKTAYTEAATIGAHIQPVDEAFGAGTMGRASKTYKMFSTSEVLIGDRIVDQNDTTFEVTGVKRLNFRSKTHYESTLRGL